MPPPPPAGETAFEGFVQALVGFSFARANPGYVAGGGQAPASALPEALRATLEEVLDRADRAQPSEMRRRMARDRALQLMLRAKGDEFDRYFERCVEREGVFGFFGRKLGGGAGAAPPVRGVPFKSALSLVGRLASLKKGAGGSVESRVARWFSESMKLAPAVASERLGISTALERPQGASLDRAEFVEFLCRVATKGGGSAATSLVRPLQGLLRELSGDKPMPISDVEGWAEAQQPHLPAETDADRDLWVATFRHTELSDLPGFQSWEKSVHDELHLTFVGLEGIFNAACRGAGSLNLERWLELLRRVHMLDGDLWEGDLPEAAEAGAPAADGGPKPFAMSEAQARAIFDAAAWRAPSERALPEFLAMLANVASEAAAGRLPCGEVTTKGPEAIPACLRLLIRSVLFTHAPIDARAAFRMEVGRTSQIRAVLHAYSFELRDVMAATQRRRGGTAAGGGVAAAQLVALLRDNALLHDTSVAKQSEIVADGSVVGVTFSCSLSVAQAKAAFAQSSPAPSTLEAVGLEAPSEGNAVLSTVDQFAECLGRCGALKFARVEGMPLAMKVEGFIKNVLGRATVDAVVTEATKRRAPPALAPLSMPRLFGESTAHFQTYVRAWCAMTLDALPGWPLWEEEVFEVLHRAFTKLGGLFVEYMSPSHDPDRSPLLLPQAWLKMLTEKKLLTDKFKAAEALQTINEAQAAAKKAGFAAVPPKAGATAAAAPATPRHRRRRGSARLAPPPPARRSARRSRGRASA